MTPLQRHPRAALVTALAVVVGCASAPTPPRPAAPVAPAASTQEVPPERLPARWLSTGGKTAIGPAVDGGTLALVGGRRALVAPDGSVREEDEPAPEPLRLLVEVPTATGKRLIALSDNALYAFDAPLGPLRPIAGVPVIQQRIGAGPGFVAVFEPEHLHWVDVTTGGPVSAFERAPLLADVAFRSMTEGVARFSPGGLATTSDGGKTFQPATGRAAELAEAVLRPPDAAADAPLLLRWIARTHADPRAVAAHHGVLVREGEALAAAGGLVARVDLATGAVRELAPYPAPDDAPPCEIERSGTLAWLRCEGTVTENEAGTGSNIERLLLEVDLALPLKPHPAPKRLAGDRGRLGSTSAGNTVRRVQCDEGRGFCLGWLRREGSAMVVFALPRVTFPSDGDGELTGEIDQAADGELRFVVREYKTGALYVVRQRVDGLPTLTPIPDATEARVVGDVGWAQRPERSSRGGAGARTEEPARFWTTSDGGATWREAPRPDGSLHATQRRTSEVGAAFEHFVRIGWGAPLPVAPRPKLPSLVRIDAYSPHLACRTMGTAPKAPAKPKARAPHDEADPTPDFRIEPAGAGDGRPTWAFRWSDPSASAKPTRTSTLQAPEGASVQAWLSSWTAGDGEAIFFVETREGDTWVVRTASSGARVVHLPSDPQRWARGTVLAPPRRGEPAAWITMDSDRRHAMLWAWDRGEPRAVMPLAPLPPIVRLGSPRGGRVPFVALRHENDVEGTATLLGLDASAKPPGLDGWAAVSSALVDAPCTARGATAVELDPMGVSLVLTDRAPEEAYVSGRGRVQLEAGRACLESVAGKGFVDLVSMRAELPAGKATLQLTCSRAAPP